VLASAALAFISGNAWAQGDQHLPLEKAVISGEGAKKALTRYQISADIARKLVDACVDYASKFNTEAKMKNSKNSPSTRCFELLSKCH